jgi:hypothetical protein
MNFKRVSVLMRRLLWSSQGWLAFAGELSDLEERWQGILTQFADCVGVKDRSSF